MVILKFLIKNYLLNVIYQNYLSKIVFQKLFIESHFIKELLIKSH